METIGKVRRRKLVKHESISGIARDLKLSRNTVRKYLKAETEPAYRRSLQPCPRLGNFQDTLTTWLEQESTLPKRQRRSAQRLYEGLQREGYLGAYDSVQRFVKRWKGSRPNGTVGTAFVPLLFAPGDACQFDWSHELVVLGGVTQTLKLAHFRLAHSRQMFLVAYPRESQEMVLDAHVRAFTFFGGVPQRMIYDNPRTIVDCIYSGKERQFNRRFLALANHYLFEPVACTPASGWEKGQVENQVGNVREWLFTPTPKFADLVALNTWLEARCRELAQRPHPQMKQQTVAEVFAQEQAHLRPVSACFDGYFEQQVRVSSTCLAAYDRIRYSVPAAYAGQRVSLRAYADAIVVVADGVEVARHVRSFARDTLVLDPWHYVPVLERKPGALRNGAPFVQWQLPTPIASVRDRLLKQPKGDRAFVEVLQAMREHGAEVVEVACALALEAGTCSAAIILNHVHRLTSPPRPPEPAHVPEALRLTLEPQADCSRYDRLREVAHVA